MEAQELAELIQGLRLRRTDTAQVEAKSAVRGLPKNLVHSLSAFSNTAGGTVILGIDEEAGFVPAEGFNANSIADALAEACSEKMVPPVRATISIEEFEGAQVVVAYVPELAISEKPCYIATVGKYAGSYFRGHDGDRLLKPYEIDRLEENKYQPAWDLEPVREAGLDDLDPDLVVKILERERTIHAEVFGKLSDEKAMKSLRMVVEDEGGKLRPTLAGLLAAGIYPQQFFPRLNVTFAAYTGTDRSSDSRGQRFVDTASFIGPIPTLVYETVQAVARNTRLGGVVKGAFRKDLPDYPPVAVREAITNALMHRDYSPQARGSQVQVDLFVDRLEITNPGGLYGAVTIESLGKYGISSTRNQHLSALLEVTPSRVAGRGFVADNRGTGYAEIIDELARELLPPPTPRDSLTSFSLTFLRRAMTVPERAAATFGGNKELIISYLREHYSATSRELAAAAGLSQNGVRKILNQLIEEGMVERMEALRSPKQRYRLVESIQ